MAKTTPTEYTQVTRSKDAPLVLSLELGGREIEPLETKDFKSGSTGYYGAGKVTIAGQKYQVTCSVILVGSLPVDEQARRAEARKATKQ
jgi:hypothetical protein